MIKAVIDVSQYILIFNMVLYTILSFAIFKSEDKEHYNGIYAIELVLIFLNHLIGYLVILSIERDINYVFFMAFQMLFLFAYIVLSRTIYNGISKQLLNHICMLLSISFVILARISYDKAMKQFKIVVISFIIALLIPYLARYLRMVKKFTWFYAIFGMAVLCLVLTVGSLTNGSKLSFRILGISFQPSEFIKIIFVMAIAGLIWEADSIWKLLLSAAIAGIHILVLVASKDLGSALIFYVVYMIMLFVTTCKFRYLLLGFTLGVIASVMGYHLFSHVRVRVANWINPWNDLNGTGYQITQSLFAIGTGRWFGMGLGGGTPSTIPYVEQDFIFSAICEEYGTIFGICLVLICISIFTLCMDMAIQCKDRYAKLIVCGLGTTYMFQVLLTIGGDTKFIPLTGVTLPLVSYGGSSVLSSMILFSIIQGLYVERDCITDPVKTPAPIPVKSRKDYELAAAMERSFFAFVEARKPLRGVSVFFIVIFTCMSLYMAYFVQFQSLKVVNNSFNSKRQEILAKEVFRGNILAADGTILATTTVSENGTETREYPFHNVFAHAVGYDTNGRMGVEQIMGINLVSSHDSFTEKIQNDLNEVKHQGDTVITTFQVDLQQAAYDALGAFHGAVIVSEPSTGKILAMVSKPDFNPNQIGTIWNDLITDSDSSVLLNRTTQGLYPPGSTFKIVTALEYIRENPSQLNAYSFDCNGKFTSGDNTIRCYHGANHGTVDFYQSFAKSCNSSFANMSLTFDKGAYEKTMDSLLFNQKIPVDFPYKESTVKMNAAVSDSELIQAAIGQGETQVTPLHMLMLTSAVANDGILMKPYCVERVETSTGSVVKQYDPSEYGRLVSVDESATLREMMELVVQEGTATKLSGLSYTAAGKTGSAEYNSNSDSHAWFTGFAPAQNPEIAVTVIVEGAGSGSEYAVPFAKRVFDAYF